MFHPGYVKTTSRDQNLVIRRCLTIEILNVWTVVVGDEGRRNYKHMKLDNKEMTLDRREVKTRITKLVSMTIYQNTGAFSIQLKDWGTWTLILE